MSTKHTTCVPGEKSGTYLEDLRGGDVFFVVGSEELGPYVKLGAQIQQGNTTLKWNCVAINSGQMANCASGQKLNPVMEVGYWPTVAIKEKK